VSQNALDDVDIDFYQSPSNNGPIDITSPTRLNGDFGLVHIQKTRAGFDKHSVRVSVDKGRESELSREYHRPGGTVV